MAGHDAGQGVKETEEGLKGANQESQKASGNIKKFAAALGLVAIGAAAFTLLRNSMDDAIARFDTLNTFPKVMEQVGFSAEESERAISRLSDGIDGLPTKLDDVTSTAQRLAVMTGDLDGAVDTTLALNNAFLASGASTADASRGLEQYVQMLAKGEVDLQSWRTLQETMGVALNDVAESFGFAGEAAQSQLYDALKEGHITFKDFNARLIELSNETGGFADRAKTASSGIATSIGNLRNAAAKGIANIIQSFDNLSKEVTGKDIAQNIDGMKNIINASFKIIGDVIEGTVPIVKVFAAVVKLMIPVVKALTPAIIGATTAYAGFLIVSKVTAIIKASTIAMGLLTGSMKAAEVATIALAAAKKLLGGPIGWVTAGIGALAGAAVGLVKWFNKSSAEAEKLEKEAENLSSSADELTESIDGTSKAYEDNIKEITASASHSENLAKKIEDLSAKENKSAEDKALLKSHIEALNGSIVGLSISYDEEADSMSMSNEQIQARVDLMKEEEKGIAAQERLAEIAQEQIDTQLQLNEVIELRDQWNQKLDEGTVKSGEHKDAIAELDEQENLLKGTLIELGEQYGITEGQVIEAANNAALAVEEGNLRQVTSYADLDERHQEVFDNMKSSYDELVVNATNAFAKMNEESKVSADEMIANLKHNQQMTEEWGTNIAELYEYASKNGHEGFLHWLEQLGPDSAAEIAVINGMSDTKLKEFAELMDDGASVAGDSFKTSLGEEFNDAVDVMINFVDDGSQTLREQIKNSGFDEIGSMVPEGLVEGIKSGTGDAEKASKDMADKTTKATKEAFDTHSPSRVYKKIGGDLTDGLSLGVRTGTAVVMRAVQTMFSRVLVTSNSSFRRVNSSFKRGTSMIRTTMVNQFQSIGLNAMSGLNVGLNAGSGRVMSTARGIANRVAATMKSALRIHSPSRVMEEEVGLETTAGIVVGLQKGARSVYSELNKLSSGMMRTSTPEAALGTSSMAHPTTVTHVVERIRDNATASVNAGNRSQTINIEAGDVIVDGDKVGTVIWRKVKEEIDRDNDIVKAFGG
ncbi:tape measure protein [Oceanobacillus sp. FSL H7-0719]|uniref:tape measure protein n=1 Tax=Oceanobacillus sp. FSL H7-0719 TaxID=2954507 RepID=UPI0032475AF5